MPRALEGQAAPAPAGEPDPVNGSLHVHVEVMIEQIAVLSARLQQMELAEQSPEKRKELKEIGKALRAMRFQFDPYNEGEVMAMVERVNRYAAAAWPDLVQTSN